MFQEYEPTEFDLDIIKFGKFLNCNNKETEDQEELIGMVGRAIASFDYYYDYSDDGNVWRAGEKQKDWIEESLLKIDDVKIREHLTAHFNVNKYKEALSIFEWGKYHYKYSDYASLIWEGKTSSEASRTVGIKQWIESITSMVSLSGASTRVVYSDDILYATKILREGVSWHNTDYNLSPITVPNKLWNELCDLGRLYKENVVKFTDLKDILKWNVDVMFTGNCEVVRINNFYMLFTYSK